jgi:dolichol kinase
VTEFHRGLLIGGVVAALVELAPTRLDDNLTVPIAAGLAMHFLGV